MVLHRPVETTAVIGKVGPGTDGTWDLLGSVAVRMVPGARIELATPAFSGRRSTNELPRHIWSFSILETIVSAVNSASARSLSARASSRQQIARSAQNRFANCVRRSRAVAPK